MDGYIEANGLGEYDRPRLSEPIARERLVEYAEDFADRVMDDIAAIILDAGKDAPWGIYLCRYDARRPDRPH